MRFVEDGEDRGQGTELPSLVLQPDVLLRLRRQEALDIRRQRRYLRKTLHPSYGGLEALEYPSQCVGLLADEGAPLQVQVSPRDIILEVKHILEHDRLLCGVCVCALSQHHDQDITLQRHDWERNALC